MLLAVLGHHSFALSSPGAPLRSRRFPGGWISVLSAVASPGISAPTLSRGQGMANRSTFASPGRTSGVDSAID
jgi:hypothetical protein